MTIEPDSLDNKAHQARLLLTPEQAARQLGVSRTTMYQLIRDGRVRSLKLNRCRRVPVTALHDYISDLMGDGDRAS